MNKKIFVIALLILTLALTACGQVATPTPAPTAAVDAPASGASSSRSGVIASAVVAPAESVELGFPMTGTVSAVEIEVGDTVSVGQTLATLDTSIMEASVAEAEAMVAKAETQVRYLRRVGTQAEHLDAALADVDAANAALESVKATLAQATLMSPVAGTVVSVDIAPAETVAAGRAVIVIADFSEMQIETTDLSERDIPAVQIGQPATVYIEALDKEFSGKVTDIARQSTTVGGDVVFTVTIALDEQPDGLRWGMSAEVGIDAGQ